MHLGGEDFDNALVDYVIREQRIDQDKIRKNNQAMKRLKVACENAKKNLSLSNTTNLRMNNLLDNVDINVVITKKAFESECKPLFERLKIPLLTAISEAEKKMKTLKKDFSKDSIDEVILVGGSTRIPKVKEFVKKGRDIENKRYKQSNILTKRRMNDKSSIYKPQCKTINKAENKSKSDKKSNIKVKNYLIEAKKNTNKKIIWDRYLNEDIEDNKVTNIKNIKGQIEGLDNNVQMKKERQ